MLRLDLLHELCSRLVGVVGHEHHPLLESQQIIHRGHGGFGILVIGWISPHFPGGKVQKNAWNHRLYSNSSPLPKRNWWHASWRKLPFPKICVFSNHHPGSQPQPYKIQSTEKRPIIFGMIFWIPRTHLHQLKGNMAGQPHFPKNRFRPTLDFVLRFKKKTPKPTKTKKKTKGNHRFIASSLIPQITPSQSKMYVSKEVNSSNLGGGGFDWRVERWSHWGKPATRHGPNHVGRYPKGLKKGHRKTFINHWLSVSRALLLKGSPEIRRIATSWGW